MYHINCGGDIVADVTGIFPIQAGVTIGKTSLKLMWISIGGPSGSVTKDIKYQCKNCNCEVKPKDLIDYCMDCGAPHPIDKLVIVGGNIFCEDCYNKRHSTQKSVSYSDMAQKLYIGR